MAGGHFRLGKKGIVAMSGRFVRASKFRHVHGIPNKKTDSYTEVKAQTSGEGNFIKGNARFFCVSSPGGGGPVLVHPVKQLERFSVNHPVVNVHKGKVLDFDWNPFIDSLLATVSEDCTAKVSVLPEEGLTENISEAAVTLVGHDKKVALAHFHPTANNVLGTSSYDYTIKVWDIEKQAEILTNRDHTELIQSFEWNTDGSMIASTCKDRTVRMYDPRYDSSALSFAGHEGSKSARVAWMENRNMLCVVGFSKTSVRKIGLWDPRKTNEKLHEIDIDQSAGVLMPFYDPDISVLYLGGKGDGTIRYYELVDEAPFIHFLDVYRSNEPQKGLCFLNKRACDTTKTEIAKALRLCRNWVEPVSFQVPRKSDNFQADLFPDSYAGIPSMTADEWLSGVNKPPPLSSMNPGKAGMGVTISSSATKKIHFEARKSPAALEAELAAANKRIQELESEIRRLKGRDRKSVV